MDFWGAVSATVAVGAAAELGIWWGNRQARARKPKPGKDCIGIGVGIVVSDGAGRFLLGLRGKDVPFDQDLWEFPGGKVEFGEELDRAACREFHEETGLLVEVVENLGHVEVVDHDYPGHPRHWYGFTMLCRVLGGRLQVMEPEKCRELRFCTPEEIDLLPLNLWAEKDWARIRPRLLEYAQQITPQAPRGTFGDAVPV